MLKSSRFLRLLEGDAKEIRDTITHVSRLYLSLLNNVGATKVQNVNTTATFS